MNLKPFTGPGSTPSRRRFWDQVTQAVIASQKVAGRFVTVDEHPSKGTVVNVADTSSRRRSPVVNTGACCDEEDNCTITTEAGCTGTFQGIGTVCDPNPCGEVATGACCVYGTCFVYSESVCTLSNGYYFGDGTDCDPDPCADLGCCITPGDPFAVCQTILGADCGGTFGGAGTFCWPEGEESFELNSCCNNGQITCSGGELGFHFCCDPGQTCCGDIGCCEEGQTCDEIFGCM